MIKEVGFVEEIGLWLGKFGDVNLIYDDIIRDLCLKPQQITDGIILLRNLGIQKIYHFYIEDFYGNSTSNINTTKNFFLYSMLDSEVILVYNSNHIILAFEENGKTVYKPDKVRYYCYRKTEIYHIYPRDVYHVYYEGVKLLTKNGEIVISQARAKP
jgi:hypothetical protein